MPSKIEWTDETWNPVTGCSHAGSPACDNCYAKRMANRLRGRCGYPEDDPFKVTFHPDKLDQPRRWRKPRRVFVVSMGDLFHDDVHFADVDEIMQVIAETFHTYMMLTKRPTRMIKYFEHYVANEVLLPDNLWLGVTVENNDQRWRIDELLKIRAAKYFVSYEPGLGSWICRHMTNAISAENCAILLIIGERLISPGHLAFVIIITIL